MTFKNRMGLAVVAAAMALGCGASQAATLTALALDYSWQGLQGAAAANVVNMPAVNVTLGTDYSFDDEMLLIFKGGVGTFMATTPADVNCGANIVVAFLNQPAPNEFLYRVTAVNVVANAGTVCTFGGVTPFASNAAQLAALPEPAPGFPLTAAGISLFYQATAALLNQPLDLISPNVPANTVSVANVYNQFNFSVVNAFKGVVDVNPHNGSLTNGRTQWVAGSTNCGGLVGEDCTNLTTQNIDEVAGAGNAGAPNNLAALGGTTIVVTGNFSFDCETAPGVELAAIGGALTVPANCQSATITEAAGVPPVGNPGTQAITLAAISSVNVLPAPQQFNATATFSWTSFYGTAGTDVISLADGQWTLNGFNAFVSYMPYGPNISQIIYLTNKSNQAGTITVTAYNSEGTPACAPFIAGTAAAGAITSLAGPIGTALTACFGAGFTDKVSFNVVANIPAGLGELYTAYNAGGNRNVVLNNSNGKVATGTIAAGAGTVTTTTGSSL